MSGPVVRLLSSACNRTPAALAWLPRTHPQLFPEGLVAYAAGSNVAIYDPHLCTVVALMRGHSAPVSAVQWIVDAEEETEFAPPSAVAAAASSATSAAPSLVLRLASGGADKQLLVWHFDPLTRLYAVQARLTGHEEGISAISALALQQQPLDTTEPAADRPRSRVSLLATTSIDLTTRIWACDSAAATDATVLAADAEAAIAAPSAESGGWRCVQVLPSGRHKIMHCLSFCFVPLPARSQLRGLLLLSVAGVDGKIHLWLSRAPNDGNGVQFAQASALEGHENWISSLDWAILDPEESAANSATAPVVTVMLASASQDRHIRLWKLQVTLPADAAAAAPAVVAANAAPGVTSTSLGSRGLILDFSGVQILVVLESVLSGHDNWVMNARWQPASKRTLPDGRRVRHQALSLLSASTDKSMLVWSPSLQSVWHHEVRVGTMGGHTLGFYGCAFSPSGEAILAHGYSGSLHLWRQVPDESGESKRYMPAVTVSGHAGSVNDMSWDAQGEYLYTTGSDQTTRLFAPWVDHPVPAARSSNGTALAPARPSWHEIARPQLHGYDLNCVAPIYDPSHSRAHCMVSGADEKVMRVFWAPMPFLHTLKHIAGVTTEEANAAARPAEPASIPEDNRAAGGGGGGDDEEGGAVDVPAHLRASPPPAAAAAASSSKGVVEHASLSDPTRALKANLPELGLSNKALRDGESTNTLRGMHHVQESISASSVNDRSTRVPPSEDYLLTHTLWPEIDKLYGHGFELLSLACSFDGALVASACVSKKAQHAVVRVWETRDWGEVLQLESHRSSVVQMAFAPDNSYLLTVGRDRHVSLFRLQAPYQHGMGKELCTGSSKLRAHLRIIWSCSWVPLRGGVPQFATGSRDKTVKLFRVNEGGQPVEEAVLPPFPSAVTAVAFAPMLPQPSDTQLFPSVEDLASSNPSAAMTLAVGLEDGTLELWQCSTPFAAAADAAAAASAVSAPQWKRLYAFHSTVCHNGRIKRLCWRWRKQAGAEAELELATCGEDHSVRIFAMPSAFLYPALASH